MKIIYLPLEPYEERYTAQLSEPGGWFMQAARRAGHEVVYISGGVVTNEVKIGKVLDAKGRCIWAMNQMQRLFKHLEDGAIVFFEDMWHPGIESIPYYCHLAGIKVYTFTQCWAQSVDIYDFTYPMGDWMRRYEQCLGEWLTGIFVASTLLKDLLVRGKVAFQEKIHVTGLPFNSQQVIEQAGIPPYPVKPRENRVLFTSRWDDEKQPKFFLEVARRMLLQHGSEAEFVATTSRPENSEGYTRMQCDCKGTCVTPVRVTKQEYYKLLVNSKVQFNCAFQDWVSFTLLEATTLGCVPVYPDFRSFPEAFNISDWSPKKKTSMLYTPWDVEDACRVLLGALQLSSLEDTNYSAIAKYHDGTHQRMFDVMEETNRA